jgi:lysophospholipase L1-like esterase
MYSRQQLESAGIRISDVQFESQVCRFETLDSQNHFWPGGIVFYGDSDISRWRDHGIFERDFSEPEIHNRGFGGARTWETLIYLERLLKKLDPRLVVFCAGDNDFFGSTDVTPEQIALSVRLLLEGLEKTCPTFQRLIYLPLHSAPCRLNDKDRQEKANQLVKELLLNKPEHDYADYLSLLNFDQGNLRPDAFVDDGLHFSEDMYSRLGKWLKKRL